MGTLFKTTGLIVCGTLAGVLPFTQVKNQSLTTSKNEMKMETFRNQEQNKAAIRNLYENILNNRDFELLDGLISEEYTSLHGEKGVDGFLSPVRNLIESFPDIRWVVEELVGEGDKVVVWQTWKGTHNAQFQAFPATGKIISNSGTAIYEFKDGKIINVQVQTDRLGFLQQLGILPTDLATLANQPDSREYISLIDKFLVPGNSMKEFTQRMNYNRDFIRKLPGFISDEVYHQIGDDASYTVITIARWANQEYVDAAKKAVQNEYKQTGFDMPGFLKRLNIKLERGLYRLFDQ